MCMICNLIDQGKEKEAQEAFELYNDVVRQSSCFISLSKKIKKIQNKECRTSDV